MEGQILGNRYELLERIGGGGMAVVYKAKCHLLNRYVAVKILRNEFIDDEEFVKRFRIEAQAAASLSHPNIVSIFDVGHEGDTHYIVMEYIDGITLKEYIDQNGPLPWREAVNIAAQICSALEHAHKNHIVHRDIKPHNILLTKEGIAKVTDFGIARAVSSATITMVGSTIGSVHYFSPEQARGGFIDEKSDLYSLGITIYEMVTGKVPFDGESPVAVALKHLQEKPERPVDINPSIPKGVNDLILKAIKKDQNLRYQSASEMLNDLQRTLAEPNAKISGSQIVEKLPTRKMQAVGTDIDMIYDEDDLDDGEEAVESDEDRTKKSKKDKLSTWMGIVTGLIVAGILFYIGFKLIVPALMPDTGSFVVQDYKKRDFNDVREELKKYDIEAVENERTYDETIPQNYIISQDVPAGNTLKQGSKIKFEVSDGPYRVTIPDLTNEESRVGEEKLRNLNLEVKVETENNETVATGCIIKTDPAALEKVEPGTLVTIFESLGPKLEMVKVPDLKGLTRAEAENRLREYNLKIGTIYPTGIVSEVAKVVKQSPEFGTEVAEESPVNLTFDVDEEGNPPDQTTPGEQTGTTPDGEKKTEKLIIKLPPNHGYGDNVQVYVEYTYSDTNKKYVRMDQPVAKKNFPFSLEIPLADTGKTHVIVKLDGEVAWEDDLPD